MCLSEEGGTDLCEIDIKKEMNRFEYREGES